MTTELPSDNTEDTSRMDSLRIVSEFHGHLCGGLAFAYRVAEAGLRELNITENPGKKILLIAETSEACGLDTFQVLLGCTIGKGNLMIKPYGKHAYTFINKKSGDAVRIIRHKEWDLDTIDPIAAKLREPVMKGIASEEEQKEFDFHMEQVSQTILSYPEEKLFTFSHFKTDPPQKEKTFRQIECSMCGEMVTENFIRHIDHKPYCIPCEENYKSKVK